MGIGSLTSAANSALSGLDRTIVEVERVAENVAAGVLTERAPGTADPIRDLAQLPVLKFQARANVRVLNTIDALFDEIAVLPRR